MNPGGLTTEQWRLACDLIDQLEDIPSADWAGRFDAVCPDPAVAASVLDALAEHPIEEAIPQAPRRTGSTIELYEIKEELGHGGMGEVYAAADPRLQRTVAIKFLSHSILKTESAIGRFMAEARASSALNHPGIVTIHEFLETPEDLAIVMERIEGTTLRNHFSGPAPLTATLDIARQVADALAAAHARGIVHRDIKPENIMVRHDGRVKVVDFGLAGLVEGGPGFANGAVTTPAGTLRYMSPEQVTGQPVTAASDIFSFALALQETLAGVHPFAALTQFSLVEAVEAARIPALAGTRQDVPAALNNLLNKMLALEPAARPTATDLISALSKIVAELAEGPIRRGQKQKRWLLAAAGSVLAILTVSAAAELYRRAVEPASSEQLLYPQLLTSYEGDEIGASFSADGQNFVFSWNGPTEDNFDIYMRGLAGGAPRRLTTDAATDYDPAWSPDGKTIAFLRERGAKGSAIILLPLNGGPEREIAALNTRPWKFWNCLDWSPDSKWLAYADSELDEEALALRAISAIDGQQRLLATPPKTDFYMEPTFSPDGKRLAFTYYRNGAGQIGVVGVDGQMNTGPVELLDFTDFGNAMSTSPRWTANGKGLLFISNKRGAAQQLWSAAMGQRRSSIRPRLVLAAPDGILLPVLSASTGRLAFTRQAEDFNVYRLSLEYPEAATLELLRPIASPRAERFGRYSPDGHRIAFESQRSGFQEIWICDADGANAFQLTQFNGSITGSPAWSPDGRSVAFDTRTDGQPEIYRIDATRGAKPMRITNNPAIDFLPVWSPKGDSVYFSSNRSGTFTVWSAAVNGGEARQVIRSFSFAPAFSPDGAFLYYSIGTEIWRMPAGGGAAEKAANAMGDRSFAPTRDGLLYLAHRERQSAELRAWNSIEKSDRLIKVLEGHIDSGISPSPDGKSVLLHRKDRSGSDLMMVEGLR